MTFNISYKINKIIDIPKITMADHSPIFISHAYLKMEKNATETGYCSRLHKTEFFAFVVNYLEIIVTVLWITTVFVIGSTHLVTCQDIRKVQNIHKISKRVLI